MQSRAKLVTCSLAMLLLGTSAALAQPYGYGGYGQDFARCYDEPYGPPDCAQLRQTPAFEQYRERNATTLPAFIIDPATNTPVTFQAYQARYPWSNRGAWQYDAVRNVWVDTTPQQFGKAAQPAGQYEGYRDRNGERNFARDRDHENGRDRDRGHGD